MKKLLLWALIVDAIVIIISVFFITMDYKSDAAAKQIVRDEFLAAMTENYDAVFTHRDSKEYGLTDFEYEITDVTKNDKSSGVYSIYGEWAVTIVLHCSSSRALDSTQKSLLAYAVESCIPDDAIRKFKTTTGSYVTTYQYCGYSSSDKMVYTYVNGELVNKPDQVIPDGSMYSYQKMHIVWAVAVCLLLLAIPGGVMLNIHHSEVKISMAQVQRKQKLIKFYDDCFKSGITECISQKEIQKAILIAERESIQFSNINDLFAEAKALKNKSIEIKETQALATQREVEKQRLSELIRYAGLSGRSKRITMLQDKYNDCIKSAQILRDGANAVMQASQFKEKEGDWAIMGGIASAIAGPAAGVATARSEQARTAQENAEVRTQNQRNREIFAPVMMTSYSRALQKEAVAKQIAEEIDAAKTKLVADDSITDCLERLCFDKTKVDVSKTGTCTVTTTVSVKPFMIFEDVPAVIDGTVIAQIYDGCKLIGTAQIVLPLYGVCGKAQLTGMSLFCGRAGNSYRVVFTSENLWAMEK